MWCVCVSVCAWIHLSLSLSLSLFLYIKIMYELIYIVNIYISKSKTRVNLHVGTIYFWYCFVTGSSNMRRDVTKLAFVLRDFFYRTFRSSGKEKKKKRELNFVRLSSWGWPEEDVPGTDHQDNFFSRDSVTLGTRGTFQGTRYGFFSLCYLNLSVSRDGALDGPRSPQPKIDIIGDRGLEWKWRGKKEKKKREKRNSSL